ncbi:MAG: hypothetical protein JNL28_16070 [Planctomycetes bacterium]|nr:hypothetical protein [Planctomycetota bacterium]
MAGRASVWNDAAVQALAQRFVPATDESWRLQTSADPEARFFRVMVEGTPEPVGGSRQGTYVCTPDGRLLARGNSTDPRRIEAVLRQGLAAWEALPPAERTQAAPESARAAHRWEDSFPVDGLALTAIHRDLARAEDGTLQPQAGRWNLDHVWFSRDEARQWLPSEPVVGARTALPEALVRRWASFHLVDNVRGQEGPFAPEDIEQAEIATVVTRSEGTRVELAIEGRTRAESDGTWKLGRNHWDKFPNRARGVSAQLTGRAVFDWATHRFVEFRMVALGEAWGGSGLNGRRADVATRHPLAWRFTLVGDTPADRIAPAFVDIYGAAWVRRPDANLSAGE